MVVMTEIVIRNVLCFSYYAKYFICIISFSLQTTIWVRYSPSPDFISGEVSVQGHTAALPDLEFTPIIFTKLTLKFQ